MKRILKLTIGKALPIGFTILAAFAAAILPAQGSLSCTPPPAGLVAWWAAENNALDSIGTNNGVPVGGLGYTTGMVGQAFLLTTTNQAVRIPASASLNVGVGAGFTVEGWINPYDVTQMRPIFEWNDATSWGVHFHISPGQPFNVSPGPGELYANIVDSSGFWHQLSSPGGAVTTNVFQHVALTYDKTTGVAAIYCNGQIVGQQNLGSFTPMTTSDAYLGQRPNLSERTSFAGVLDEFSLYNRALASNEIAAIYNAGSAGKCGVSAAPVVTAQPTNQTVLAGGTASFNVGATGSLPLSFQWRFNGTNLAGATNRILTLTNVQPSQAGNYAVLVTNIYGGALSSNAVLTVMSSPTNTTLPAGIVAWWAAENNALDSIGTNNGVPVGGLGYTTGMVGQAFLLTTTNQAVRIPASASLNVGVGAGFTVEGWINPYDVTQMRPIFEWNDATSWGVHFHISPGQPFNVSPGPGELYANIVDSSGFWHQLSSPGGAVTTNVFQHVALTYDKTTGVAAIYCNGQIVGQQNLGSFTPMTTSDAYLGQRPNLSERTSFAGVLDEFSLYNRALASNEIAAIYNAGSAGKSTPSASAVPVISNFTPASGANGTIVTISGTNFSPIAASNIVYFGAVQAVVSSASRTNLMVGVPAGATYAPITVTVNGFTVYSSIPFLPTFPTAGGGAGSLNGPTNLNAGDGPARVVIGDLDGDGKPDVVVANVYDDSVWIYRNISTNGALAASFAPPVSFVIGGGNDSLYGLALADLNGDGRLDIVVASRNLNQVSIFQNLSSSGNLTSNSFAARIDFPVAGTPTGVAVMDLDGDGRPDIVTANQSSNTVSILRNLGLPGNITTNSFSAPINFDTGSSPNAVVIADIDGDGQPDLITANNSSSSMVAILRNTSTKVSISFASKVEFAGLGSGGSVVVGDLDGDGKLDVVCGSQSSGQAVSVYRNTSNPGSITTNSLAPKVDFDTGGWANTVAIADVDGDGKPDLLAVVQLSSHLSVFRNISTSGNLTTSSFGARLDYSSGWNPNGIAIGDLDGDGRPEIVFGNAYDDTIGIYQNQTPFGTPPTCTPTPAGLVGWWQGESNANDSIGTNNASLAGGATFAPGKVGQGFRLDGTNGYVQIPDSDALKPTNVTIEAWVWLDPALVPNGGSEQIVFKKNTWSAWFEGYSLLKGTIDNGDGTSSNHFQFCVSRSGNQVVINSKTIAQRGVWYHVAATYDGNQSALYVNGVLEATATPGFALDYDTTPIFIGTSGTWAPYLSMLGGIIDEVSIYNRALSTNEISAIYNAGSAGKCASGVAPVIALQPTNQTIIAGGTAGFTVTIAGSLPVGYQWSLNGTNIDGATNSILALTNVQPSQAGNYAVLVTNIYGVALSSNALLTVIVPAIPPTILAQTPSQIVLLSNIVTFSVTVDGTPPLSYFWSRNGALIPNATNASYTFTAQLADSGSKFSCQVTNAFGVASSTNASLKVLDTVANDLCSGAIIITNGSYTNLQSTLKASAFGDPVPGCVDGFGHGVWYQFTAPVAGRLTVDTLGSDFDTGLAIYTGACDALTEVACNDDTDGPTSLLTIPTTAGTTYAILVGGYGSAAGNLVLHLNYWMLPSFDVQPTNLAVVVSSNASFATTISGTQPIGLQWYFNNTPLTDGGRISGATNTTLNLAGILPADAGNYQLVASNIVGVVTSSVAMLTPVILPPVITQQPVSQIVLIGSNVTFTAVVAGTPPYGYQWYFNGTALVDDAHISGSTTASLSLTNILATDLGSYMLTVTNGAGSTNSTVATLTLLTPASIAAQPVGRSVPPGLPTTFSIAVSGNPTPSYQWQLNGTNIPGATGTSYTIASVGTNDLGFYHLIASNWVGVATSTDAQLTFGPVAAWGRNLANESLPPAGLSNVVAVAGTYGASFAAKADGSVVAWGSGIATNVPTSATNIVALAASGSAGVVALRANGTLIGWNNAVVPPASNIVAVASGASGVLGTLALRAEGTVVSSGNIIPPTGLANVKAVASGYTHCLALRTDGMVVVWGTGAGTNVPSGLASVVGIAAGYSHSLALKADGRIVAWGTGNNTNIPAGLTNVAAISASCNAQGQSISLAIRSNGTVVVWGDNSFNQTNPPSALSNLVSVALGASAYHALALVNDGSPQIIHPPVGLTAYMGRDVTLHGDAVGVQPLSYQWLRNGTNLPGATGTSLVLSNVQASDAGSYQLLVTNTLGSTLSLSAPVTVISNSALVFLSQPVGQTNVYQGGKAQLTATVLGSGPVKYQWYFGPSPSVYNQTYTPVVGATNDSLTLEPALASQTGYYYLTASNNVSYSIGGGINSGISSTPVYVRVQFARAWGFQSVSNPPVNVTNAIAIATGGYQNYYGHYLALGADGKLTAWANYSSPYGETNVSALSNSFVTAIAAGSQHSFALKSDGTVYAWGAGATNPPAGLNGVVAIACGGYHDLALKSDGSIVGWMASTPQYNYGQATNFFMATNVVAIAAGAQHSVALRADGTVCTWGYGISSQTIIPPTATNIIAIAAGNNFSVALRANGTVVQWGSGITSYPVPANLSNVVAISAASTHCTALRNDGTVVSWGYEYAIQIASNAVPADLANVIAISSGGDHDFGLLGNRAPSFTVQPWNRSVPLNAGTNVVLAAKCAGVQPVSYQWQLNGTNLPNATNDTLSLGGRAVTGAPLPIVTGNYQLVASNAYGVVSSKPAKITAYYPLAEALDTLIPQDYLGRSFYNWLTSGNTLWYGQTNVSHDGVDAARSGAIGALQETILQTTVGTNIAGRYSFWWKVSSEQFFDTLEFRVNGVILTNISGEVNWQQVNIPVAAGTNILQWRYSKDSSYDAGQDAGWVDQFAFYPNAPVITVQPVSQIVNQGTNLTLSVTATGTPTLRYQWRQNGSVVGSSASLVLSNVSRAQSGTYFVTVTNAGGSTVSSNVTVKVLVPQVLSAPKLLPDGSLQLTSGDAGGGSITVADLANFEVQVSTNLVNWATLPDGLSLTNGTLQLQDNGRTNSPSRFYRIIEH